MAVSSPRILKRVALFQDSLSTARQAACARVQPFLRVAGYLRVILGKEGPVVQLPELIKLLLGRFRTLCIHIQIFILCILDNPADLFAQDGLDLLIGTFGEFGTGTVLVCNLMIFFKTVLVPPYRLGVQKIRPGDPWKRKTNVNISLCVITKIIFFSIQRSDDEKEKQPLEQTECWISYH